MGTPYAEVTDLKGRFIGSKKVHVHDAAYGSAVLRQKPKCCVVKGRVQQDRFPKKYRADQAAGVTPHTTGFFYPHRVEVPPTRVPPTQREPAAENEGEGVISQQFKTQTEFRTRDCWFCRSEWPEVVHPQSRRESTHVN